MEFTLPYLLRHENIARIEEGRLIVGDRRSFPAKNFVCATTARDVHDIIKNMVTQGGGPLEAGLRWIELRSTQIPAKELKNEAALICSARPTNTTLKKTLDRVLAAPDINAACKKEIQRFDDIYETMGILGGELIEDGDCILTTCFPEHTVILSLLRARSSGKRISVIVPETRPYNQGSRLTAPSLEELGFEVTLVSDNMCASLICAGRVQKYLTAADRVLYDNTVVNKLGTLSNAVFCKKYGIPYYAFSITPDTAEEEVEIEFRDNLPVFDVVPAEYVTGIVTPDGVRLTNAD